MLTGGKVEPALVKCSFVTLKDRSLCVTTRSGNTHPRFRDSTTHSQYHIYRDRSNSALLSHYQIVTQVNNAMVPNTLIWEAATPIQSEWSWLRPRDFDKLLQRCVEDCHKSLSFELECTIGADCTIPTCLWRSPFQVEPSPKKKRDEEDYEEGQSSADYLEGLGPSKPSRKGKAGKKRRS